MKLTTRISIFLSCALLCSGMAFGQVITGMGGTSGDGIPDVVYDPTTGYVTVDTDGIDAVAIFIGGADVSQPPTEIHGCNLCDGMNLPGTDALAGASTWTVGFSAGSTQWIRTNPLSGDGFRGVLADNFIDGNDQTQPWPDDVPPFLDFPVAGNGIANYGLNATFDAVFSDGTGEANWEVTVATDDGRTVLTNVVPEPATASLLSLAGLAFLGLRRRS